MITFLLIGFTLVLMLAAWLVYRRWALCSLRWNPNLTTFQMARKCRTYLRLQGIDTILIDGMKKWGPRAAEGPVNLRMTNEQFGKKLPIIKIVCRDHTMKVGETFYWDVNERRSKNNDWTSLVVVLRIAPPDATERHWAESHCVAMIGLSELPEFAKALKMIKMGAKPIYDGPSATLARTLNTGSIGLARKKPA